MGGRGDQTIQNDKSWQLPAVLLDREDDGGGVMASEGDHWKERKKSVIFRVLRFESSSFCEVLLFSQDASNTNTVPPAVADPLEPIGYDS